MIYDSHNLPCSWTSAIPVGKVFPGLDRENITLLKCCPKLQYTYDGKRNQRKFDFQRLSGDWMISCQEWKSSLFASSCFPLSSFPGKGEWDQSPLKQGATILLCLQTKIDAPLNLSLNHWWDLTGCCRSWNSVQLQFISAEKFFSWEDQELILKKAEQLQCDTFLFHLHYCGNALVDYDAIKINSD